MSGEGIRAGFGLLSRLKNRPVQYLLDVSVLSAALLLAYAIRFDFHVSPETSGASKSPGGAAVA